MISLFASGLQLIIDSLKQYLQDDAHLLALQLYKAHLFLK